MALWVVEVKLKDRWEPTLTSAFVREDARENKKDLESANPEDSFRVRSYHRTVKVH